MAMSVKTETKPVWSSSSFLIYAGGLTVLEGAVAAFAYLAVNFRGSGQMTAWALLIFAILVAIAHVLRRADQWIPAGIFAHDSVIAWAILLVVAFHWWGWENGTFGNFQVWSWPRLLLEALVLLAATVTRWRFKFPYLRSITAPLGAFFVVDLVTKGHGNPLAVVALLVGLAYLFYGHVSDKPSTFWLHLTAGYLIGIPIVYWCHHSTFDFTVIAFMSLVYVIWAYWTKRSSWAVYGAIGFFVAAGHYVVQAVDDTTRSAAFSGQSPAHELWYVPLAIGLLGFWLVLLGMLGKRKKGDDHDPVKKETKPVWTASSFLVYTGGLTVLVGAAAGLVYLGYEYRSTGAETGWTLLFFAILYGLAHALRLRGRWLAAGIFAFVSVFVWATLVLLTMHWIGWHPFNVFSFISPFVPFSSFGPFGHSLLAGPISTWSWSRMLFWVLILAAAWYDRRVFKFPFIRLISAVVFYLFLIDLLTVGFGNWFTVVTLLTGLGYLAVGHFMEKPSAFWLHLVGGALIAGAVLKWFHTSDADFAVISIVSLAYVAVAYWTKRSSWAVYGTIGFFEATNHYVTGSFAHINPLGILAGVSSSGSCTVGPTGSPICTTISYGPPWSPGLAYGLLGFFLVALGMLGSWKRGHAPAAAVVTTPAPPAPPAAAAVAAAEPPPAAEEPPAE
jgi:hypothetical protein